jgi:hypothetical protein
MRDNASNSVSDGRSETIRTRFTLVKTGTLLCPAVILAALLSCSPEPEVLCAVGFAGACSQIEESKATEEHDPVYWTPCKSDKDCYPSEFCSCQDSGCYCMDKPENWLCDNDSDCSPGFKCDAEQISIGDNGTCVPGEEGEACLWGTCRPGLVCVAESTVAASGHCGIPGPGAECLVDLLCPPGFECRKLFHNGKKACASSGKMGDPCDPQQFQMCDGGLGCNTLTIPGSCEQAGSPGTFCFEDGNCDEGLFCTFSLKMCLTGQDHSPCAQDFDCAMDDSMTYDCIEELGVCSGLGNGAPCLHSCSPPLHCVTGPPEVEWPICQDGSAGAYCDSHTDCNIGQQCIDSVQGWQCGATLEEGEECSDDLRHVAPCADGLACNQAHVPPKCMPLGDNGAPCLEDSACSEGGGCIFGVTGTGVCTDGELGSPCLADSHCDLESWCAPGSHTCGTGNEGAACILHGDCNAGLYCPVDTHVCTEGGHGTPCTKDSHCPTDFSCVLGTKCQDGSEGDLCESNAQCQDPLVCVAVDDKCHSGQAGDPCITDHDCMPDLFCVESQHTCAAGGVDDPCDSDSDCGVGSLCIASVQLCHTGSKGEPCDSQAQCHPDLWCVASAGKCHGGSNGEPCDSQEECQLDQWCVSAVSECHNGTKGEPCAVDDDCLPFLWCALSVGQCQDGSPGAPCDAHSQCQQGTDCDGDPAICLSGFELWPCTDDNDCQPDFSCVEKGEGLCYDGSLADPCIQFEDCAKDLYCATMLPAPLCVPAGKESDACTVDQECETGLYCFLPEGTCYDGSGGDPCFTNEQCEEDFCDEGECW